MPLKALPRPGWILQVDSRWEEGTEEPTGARQQTAHPVSPTSSLTAFVPRTRDPDRGNSMAGRPVVMEARWHKYRSARGSDGAQSCGLKRACAPEGCSIPGLTCRRVIDASPFLQLGKRHQ